MNTQNFGEIPDNTSDFEDNKAGSDDPMAVSDSAFGKVQSDAGLVPGVPMSGTEAAGGLVGETIVHDVPAGMNAGSLAPLLNREDSEQLRTRWNEIQGQFVDEPRMAVQQADELVSEVVQKIIKIFASEHSSLEGQWNQGIDVSTEDLRKALVQYRSFFN